jgi:hypothetical protein
VVILANERLTKVPWNEYVIFEGLLMNSLHANLHAVASNQCPALVNGINLRRVNEPNSTPSRTDNIPTSSARSGLVSGLHHMPAAKIEWHLRFDGLSGRWYVSQTDPEDYTSVQGAISSL